jgi:hypothetical protein
MANRTGHPFIISSQHRTDFGVALAPGQSAVATLALRPRAQMTPEERTTLGSGIVRHQWGLGIGPDPCNKLYIMHRAVHGDFATAELVIQFKTNPDQSTSDECGNRGYGNSTVLYTGPDLGVLVVERSQDGNSLLVRGYDVLGTTLLVPTCSSEVPSHWNRDCRVSLRGDNCFASGVVTL